jgi:hypothetical protein
MLFSFSVKYALRKVQEKWKGIELKDLSQAAYADDVDLGGRKINIINLTEIFGYIPINELV